MVRAVLLLVGLEDSLDGLNKNVNSVCYKMS